MKSAALLLALVLPAPAIDLANYIDVLSTRSVHTSGLDFNELTRGDADFSQSSLFALLGKVGDSELTWVPALNYDYSTLDLNAYPFGANPAAPSFDRGLHRISMPNFLIYNPSGSRWFHGAYLAPGLYSEFDDVNSRDFFLSAAIGSGYQFSDCLTVGFGVYASDITNDPFVIPAPVFFWTPNDDWLVAYYGPRFLARRDIGDNHQLGFEAAWNGGSWSVDAFRDDARLDVSSVRTGLYYKFRVAGHVWLELGAGYTFANEVKLRSPGGRDLFPAAYGEADSAPYVSFGISVNRW